jgi:hypothetical protein
MRGSTDRQIDFITAMLKTVRRPRPSGPAQSSLITGVGISSDGGRLASGG